MNVTHPLFLTFAHEHTSQALRSLVDLVRRDGGRITVLAVIPTPTKLQRLLTPRSATAEVETVLRRALCDELRRWVKTATGEADPADVTIEIADGHAVAEVLHRIVEFDHDLLAVTSDPDDPTARAVIKRLQRKSPCPVWAIRPTRARKRRILAALDTDPDHHGLDHRILAAARWLARPGDELHVATAWELLGEATLRNSPFVEVGDAEVDELRSRCERDHRATLDQLMTEHEFGDLDVELHLVPGPAPEVIVELVHRHKINQLVLGTIGRTGIPGFVIGNTAEQLLSEVPCAEFVVKPPGFTSAYHL